MSLLKVAGTTASSGTLYVDDVFSTYLYTGNASTQTITNGIDLAGKGGLVWSKGRNNPGYNHTLMSTAYSGMLFSDTTQGANAYPTDINSYNSNGFTLKASTSYANISGTTYASWTFRNAAKFFDVVTYTGTGSARTIAHSLGVAPGMVIVKRTDTTGNWQVYSNGLTSAAYSIQLNLTNAQASAPTVWNSTAPTSSVFSVGTDATVNASGGTYVAYLYAHDTSSTGIIQCGSFTYSGSSISVNLGWEPQYLLYKNADAGDYWNILDSMRGWSTGAFGSQQQLYADKSNAESTGSAGISPTATGFLCSAMASNKYIYMAIRMPNKPPTSGTQVYNAIARTGTGAAATVTGGQTDDAVLIKNRGAAVADLFSSRLTGTGYLVTSSTAAEVAAGTTILQANPWDVMDGVKVGTTSTITNASANTFINYLFKRAPGFFDVVCYTGTGSATTVAHGLGVVPELMIIKPRNNVSEWGVYSKQTGAGEYLDIHVARASVAWADVWNNTTPTANSFSVGSADTTNGATYTLVAYLFATLAGIQYINSYVGDGTTGRVINCNFSAGARFICIKATSTTGSWWVWDSARGITAGNDPALQLNSTAAEITSADAIDPSSSGFIVNQEATCSINASGVSYLVWAIA